MTRSVTTGTRLAAVVVTVALVGCAKGEQASSADSTARNLTLAPTESTAALRDAGPGPGEDRRGRAGRTEAPRARSPDDAHRGGGHSRAARRERNAEYPTGESR